MTRVFSGFIPKPGLTVKRKQLKRVVLIDQRPTAVT